MSLPEYRAGDNVYAGRPILDVFDLSAMEIRIHVGEQERTNVAKGQAALVRFDSLRTAVDVAFRSGRLRPAVAQQTRAVHSAVSGRRLHGFAASDSFG